MMMAREPAVQLKRVVVAVDFASASMAAATWVARNLGRGTELVLVHAVHVPEPPAFLRGRYPPSDQLIATARAGAEKRIADFVAVEATGLVWTEVRVGAPDVVVVEVARDYSADLVVVGRHTPRGDAWERLGTTTERIIRRSEVPVLIVPEGQADAPRRLLAAVDGSTMTLPVLQWADLLADRFRADATVAHVLQTSPFTAAVEDPIATPGASEETMRAEVEQWLGEELGRLPHGDRMTPSILDGRPAAAILAEADRLSSDLLVVGSRGAGPGHRLLLGSVSEAVMRAARCAVLVAVPPTDEMVD